MNTHGEIIPRQVGAEVREDTPAERAAARLCAYAAADAATRRVVLAELCRPTRQDPGAADHWVRAFGVRGVVDPPRDDPCPRPRRRCHAASARPTGLYRS